MHVGQYIGRLDSFTYMENILSIRKVKLISQKIISQVMKISLEKVQKTRTCKNVIRTQCRPQPL